MKKEINPLIVEIIMDCLANSDREHPVNRETILTRLPCGDREMRWTYSMMPSVGELGNGLFIKRTSLDWKQHNAMMKSRVRSTMDRIKRCEKAEQDMHQYNLKWLHQKFIRTGECPKFLCGATNGGNLNENTFL